MSEWFMCELLFAFNLRTNFIWQNNLSITNLRNITLFWLNWTNLIYLLVQHVITMQCHNRLPFSYFVYKYHNEFVFLVVRIDTVLSVILNHSLEYYLSVVFLLPSMVSCILIMKQEISHFFMILLYRSS